VDTLIGELAHNNEMKYVSAIKYTEERQLIAISLEEIGIRREVKSIKKQDERVMKFLV